MGFLAAVRRPVDSSPIGVGLPTSPLLLLLPIAFMLHYLRTMIWYRSWPHLFDFFDELYVWTGLGALVLLVLARGRRSALGLVLTPLQGWGPWLRYSAVAAGLVTIAGVPVAAILYHFGMFDLTGPETGYRTVADVAGRFLDNVVITPIFEETLFRVVILASLAAVLGRWWALLISAVLFGAWHWMNPSATNLIAGFAFGWAYLASGSLAVPVLWHAAGNLTVLLANIATAR